MPRFRSLAVLMLLSSCSPSSGDPKIDVADAWARPALGAGQMSAAYLTIRNSGSGDDRLLAAASDAAERITLHSSSHEGGIARMRPIDNGLAIAAGGEETLAPGGNHMMLEGLKRPLAVGEHIRIDLRFERSGAKSIDAVVSNAPSSVAHQGH